MARWLGIPAVSPADAAIAVLSRWQAVFCPGSGGGNYYSAAGVCPAGLLLTCCLLLLGRRASCQFRRRGCVRRGSRGCRGWAWSTIWPRRSHRPDGSACPPPEKVDTGGGRWSSRVPTLGWLLATAGDSG